jgi:hypothetical protein
MATVAMKYAANLITSFKAANVRFHFDAESTHMDGQKSRWQKARSARETAGDLDWTYNDRPLLEDLLTLKEILVRKYQRRRASIEDVASIEKLIQEQRVYE